MKLKAFLHKQFSTMSVFAFLLSLVSFGIRIFHWVIIYGSRSFVEVKSSVANVSYPSASSLFLTLMSVVAFVLSLWLLSKKEHRTYLDWITFILAVLGIVMSLGILMYLQYVFRHFFTPCKEGRLC